MISPGRSLGRWYMEVWGCTDYMVLLLAVPSRAKVLQCITFEADLAEGVAGNLSGFTVNHLRDSTKEFLSEFASTAFSVFAYDRKFKSMCLLY